MMLRTNLSTRPFYNERAVTAALVLVALVVVAFTVLNVTRLVALTSRQATIGAAAGQAERSARELRQNISIQ